MTLTREQWAAVEKSLAYPHGEVKLECDGRKVTAQVKQTKPLKYSVMVYVDGWMRGEWLRADQPCDEQRFYNPHERSFYKATEAKQMAKAFGARKAREMLAQKFRWFSPDFPTGKAFRRRISATCKDVRLIDCSEARLAVQLAQAGALAESPVAKQGD